MNEKNKLMWLSVLIVLQKWRKWSRLLIIASNVWVVNNSNLLARFTAPRFCNAVTVKYVHGNFHTFLVVPFITHTTRCRKVICTIVCVLFKICSASDKINISIDCYSSRSLNSFVIFVLGKGLNVSDFKHSTRWRGRLPSS